MWSDCVLLYLFFLYFILLYFFFFFFFFSSRRRHTRCGRDWSSDVCSSDLTDHKMIAKQFLITGVIMGVIGIVMSLLFRIQIAWPEESFRIFSWLLGDEFAPGGVMRNDIYLALVTIHGTIMVFFVLTAGLSGTLDRKSVV